MPEFGNKNSWEGLIKAHKLRDTSEVLGAGDKDVLDIPFLREDENPGLQDFNPRDVPQAQDEQSHLAYLGFKKQEQKALGLKSDVVLDRFNPLDAIITKKRGVLDIDIEGNRFSLLKNKLNMDEGERSGNLTVTVDAQLTAEEGYYIYEIALRKFRRIFKNSGVAPVLQRMRQESGEKPGQYNLIFDFSTVEVN